MTKLNRNKIRLIVAGIIFLGLSVLPETVVAQRAPKGAKRVEKTVERRQEQLAAQKEEKERKAQAQLEERRQRHIDIQTKKVQKRMKKSRKKSNRINDRRREFFLKRWFTKRR